MTHITTGKRTDAYKKVQKELEPVSSYNIPKSFKREEWAMLPYDQKLDFVKQKKEMVIAALQKRLTSPVVSLLCDLAELETKMETVSIQDAEKDKPMSREYVQALKLKIELAKALKNLTEKNIITHKHIVERLNDDKDVIDVNFEELFDPVESVKVVEQTEEEEKDE